MGGQAPEFDSAYSGFVTTAGGTPQTDPVGLRGLLKSLATAIGTGGASTTATVSANAVTITPTTGKLYTVTNSSAATLTITLATAGATDGQQMWIRVYDASAASQTITWVNTENGEGTAPTTSNGSTTLPKTALFMFNAATTKWRCIIT